MADINADEIPAQDPGDAFEETCWGLLRRRYPPEELVYLPATMGGDCGIEGFSTDGIAYQCYADRESATLRHRTNKQKKKLYNDTEKLKKYAARLAVILAGVKIDYLFLMVPQYHAIELVAYANRRAEVIVNYELPFIGPSFAIRIKTPDDYPAELRAALMDGAAKVAISEPQVDQTHVALFSGEKPELVQVMEGKLAVLASHSPETDIAAVRDHFIRSYLAKEQVMEALRDWPDTWEAVEGRRELREERLGLESELSPESPNRRVMSLIRDYEADLIASVGGVREIDAQRLAFGQAGEWLMRCPLRFKAAP